MIIVRDIDHFVALLVENVKKFCVAKSFVCRVGSCCDQRGMQVITLSIDWQGWYPKTHPILEDLAMGGGGSIKSQFLTSYLHGVTGVSITKHRLLDKYHNIHKTR